MRRVVQLLSKTHPRIRLWLEEEECKHRWKNVCVFVYPHRYICFLRIWLLECDKESQRQLRCSPGSNCIRYTLDTTTNNHIIHWVLKSINTSVNEMCPSQLPRAQGDVFQQCPTMSDQQSKTKRYSTHKDMKQLKAKSKKLEITNVWHFYVINNLKAALHQFWWNCFLASVAPEELCQVWENIIANCTCTFLVFWVLFLLSYFIYMLILCLHACALVHVSLWLCFLMFENWKLLKTKQTCLTMTGEQGLSARTSLQHHSTSLIRCFVTRFTFLQKN